MALELVDQRAAYYPNSAGVRFFAADNVGIRLCVVSIDALQAHCGLCSSNPEEVIDVAETNRQFIERIARRKYEAGNTEPAGHIVLSNVDFIA